MMHIVTRAGPRLTCFRREALVLNVTRVGAREEKRHMQPLRLAGKTNKQTNKNVKHTYHVL